MYDDEIDDDIMVLARRLLHRTDLEDCSGDKDLLVQTMLEVINGLQNRGDAMERIYKISGEH